MLPKTSLEDNSNELRASAHHQASVKPLRRWAFGLVWASAAVAMLLGGGALVSRFGPVRPERRDVSTVASNTQPASSSPPSAPAMTEQTATTKSAPLRTIPSKGPVAIASGGQKNGDQHQPEQSAATAPAAEGAQTPPSAVGTPEITAPAPDTRNAFVANQADTLSQLGKAAAAAKPSMSMGAFQSTRGQWRISADGHLERRGGADGWTRVLNDEAATLHAVSVVGDNVWAGGEDGALFHSGDGGQHWKRVPLISGSATETGSIISIQFENSQQGTVLTAGGARWSTSDGAVSWILQ